jgi:phage tail protein X
MSTARTIQGDFYDLVCYRRYGSEYYMDALIEANPDVHLVVRFNAGEVLNVPEIEPIPIAGLAPWRRVVKLR